MLKFVEKLNVAKLTESGKTRDKTTLSEETGFDKFRQCAEVKKDCFFPEACYNKKEPNTQTDGCR